MLGQPPPPLPADIPQTLEDEHALDVPLLLFVVDDSRRSKVLRTYANLDDLRVKQVKYVRWDDFDAIRKHRVRALGDEFPAYRFGSSGPVTVFPARGLRVNAWVTPTIQCLVREYWFYEELDQWRDARAAAVSKWISDGRHMEYRHHWIVYNKRVYEYFRMDRPIDIVDRIWWAWPAYEEPEKPMITWPWEGVCR